MDQAENKDVLKEKIMLTQEEQYQLLTDTMKVGICNVLLNEEFTFLWGNDSFYENLGYQKAEFQSLYNSFKSLYHNHLKDFDFFKTAFKEAADHNKKNIQFICCLPKKENTSCWMQIQARITDKSIQGDSIVEIVCLNVDETINKQQEAERVKEMKAQNFEWMMSEYVGNVYISDMDNYDLLYVNKTSCETLQEEMKNLIGRKCYEVIQGRTSPCPFCTNDRLTCDEAYEWEFYNPILERTFMIKNRQIEWEGRRARIELSHDMFSAEYKLAKKDQEREAIIKTIPGGLSRIEARNYKKVIWYSGDYLEMIGYTAEQFESELNSEWTYVCMDDQERILNIAKSLHETGQNAVLETKIKRRNGEERILTITMCYISGEDSWDGIPSIYSVGIDITKERQEQDRQRTALEDAYKAARVANAAKTNFLSSMSHDIRTPMNAIVGMTVIAKANINAPDKLNDCLNKINVSSRHLLSLINEVLDMSKIESGKIDLLPENVDLPELIENITDMCKSLVEEKHLDFQIVVGHVSHEKVIADGERIKQIFMNLLSNAIKYTPEGGTVRFTINEVESMVRGRGRYEFIFTDTGIGMPKDFIPHLFEPFSRAEDSRISKIQGTGLGMAITENIIHMMNGTIEVTSELGKGSQFIVSLPLQLQIEEEKKEEELIGNSVLVVDDDQMVCESAVLLLKELGIRGSWVLSGNQAVQDILEAHINKEDYFAVILDWKMPEMDGLETIRQIRKIMGEDVPIIIISAYDYSEIEDEFIRAGADAFITKPLFKSKMLHVLQLFCSSNSLETTSDYAEHQHIDLCGKRVLLAEDNELNREIAAEILQMQGILVDTAENGMRAAEMYAASCLGGYDAILMDIQMPVMDGYEATARIRSMEREDAKTIPILALTANAFITDIGKAQNAGMNDHIAKPIDVEVLIKTLQKWLD